METLIEILKAVVFGFVEGITEWLPISSTGHLILLGNFISFDLPGDAAAKASFMELYDVVIQLGAILAVVVIFIKEIWPFGIENPDKEVKRKVGDLEEHYWRILGSPLVIRKDIFMLWVKIALACIPGLAYGLLLDDLIETVTAPVMTVIVAVMLIIVGIVFVVVELIKGKEKPAVRDIKDITIPAVLIIGLAQVVAGALPGTSRSGATIIAGLLLGLSRTVAAEFTFYLAIPTMFGASLLKMLKYLSEGMSLGFREIAVLCVSSAVAFIVSMVSIRFLMGYVKKHDFKVFAWYRIVLGVLVLALVIMGFMGAGTAPVM